MPKRRWLRFSIRTLLVAVTIICVWLGWQTSIVWKRKSLVQSIIKSGGNATPIPDRPLSQRRQIKGIRRALGDEAFHALFFAKKPEPTESKKVEAAFPEAEIWFFNGRGWEKLRDKATPSEPIKLTSPRRR